MASIKEQLLVKAETALGQDTVAGTTKPLELRVHRFIMRPVNKERLPDQTVYWSQSQSEERASAGLDRRMRIRVRSRVKVPSGTAHDTALDPLLVWAEKALTTQPASDPSIDPFDGLAFKCTPVDEGSRTDEADEEIAEAVQEFEIHYQTRRGDPETQ